ncbi:hypothetical protein P256_01061 [Acinetobacter nectaris CIP 110549]|uniref:HTH hxlR-type domain-containing protein n=1 Tax=Acinetobacter nectaris CIP 110549 TaxID=1392540 RepID=V2TRF1_9GAMM|nr:helix-turn-helix domain-containing protein [Acinetobacter nectaris]ESK40606.1 hypothetical protein P256_01061 [Acinetobacter nectaris CIP 110549]
MENKTNDVNMHEEMRRAFNILSGKWKLEIMWLLNQKIYRFGELKKGIPGITQHMLTTKLRELEADGLISRKVYAEVPPRVEYSITAKAKGLEPTMRELTKWWIKHKDTTVINKISVGRPTKQ